jgi:hypothetical protein
MRALIPSKAACSAYNRSIRKSYQLRRSIREYASAETPATAALSPRWLSDVKQRIGKCITFGLRQEQKTEAAAILDEICIDWRELLAGSEGFLTSPQRRGLFRRRVIWGEQDSMVCLSTPASRGISIKVLLCRLAKTAERVTSTTYFTIAMPRRDELSGCRSIVGTLTQRTRKAGTT